MVYTDKQTIDVIRNAAEQWWWAHPEQFRWSDGTVKVPALKQMMRRISGIAAVVRYHEKDIAWHVEWTDQYEKERLLEAALWIYRVGYRTRQLEEAMAGV